MKNTNGNYIRIYFPESGMTHKIRHSMQSRFSNSLHILLKNGCQVGL
jgi:hypothetical protein